MQNTFLKFLRIIVTIALIGISNLIYAQVPYKEFFPDDYPESIYRTQLINYYLEPVKIKVIEVMNKKSDENSHQFCRAWIKVIQNDTVVSQFYVDNITSTTNCDVLFIPEIQPHPDYFIIAKYGDYDGRTIVIDRNGKLFNMSGGQYFITKDNRFMFSIYESDRNEISVFDFKTDHVVYFNDSLSTKLEEWYFQDGRYFSMDQEAEDDEGEDTEAESMNYALLQFPIKYFDFVTKQLKKDKLTFANLREENRLVMTPVIKKIENCTCK